MARSASVVRKRTQPDQRVEPCRLPPSQLRALELASLGELTGKTGRYEVLLSDRRGGRRVAFRTDGLTGPDRVDLEDACELGGYDTVLVRRRRGPLGAKEAVRLLGEVIDDLTYEAGNDLRFFLLDAANDGVLVQLHTDFDPLVRAGGEPFRAGLLEMLQLCGFDPVVERATPRWLHLSIGPRDARGCLLVPLGAALARATPLPTRSRFTTTKVLCRPQDRVARPVAEAEGGFLELGALIRALHSARIGTLGLALLGARRASRSRKPTSERR